jgi:hypothetical protein
MWFNIIQSCIKKDKSYHFLKKFHFLYNLNKHEFLNIIHFIFSNNCYNFLNDLLEDYKTEAILVSLHRLIIEETSQNLESVFYTHCHLLKDIEIEQDCHNFIFLFKLWQSCWKRKGYRS